MFFTKARINRFLFIFPAYQFEKKNRRYPITLSCFTLACTSHSEKCSMLVSWRSISVSHTRMLSRAVSNSSRWPMKCWREKGTSEKAADSCWDGTASSSLLLGRHFLHEQREHRSVSPNKSHARCPSGHPCLTESPRLCPNAVLKWPQSALPASKLQRARGADLESAQDGGDALLQVVPSLVAFVNHLFEAAGRVRAVLSGQAAVLLVDQLQLGQALMDLSLESLRPQRSTSTWEIWGGRSARVSGRGVVMSDRMGGQLFPSNRKTHFVTSANFPLLKKAHYPCALRKGADQTKIQKKMANSSKYLYIYKSTCDTHIEYVHIHVEHIHMIHTYKMYTHTYIYIYKWQPTPVFLPREFHGQRSLVGFSPWGHKDLDTTERLSHTHSHI